MANYTGMKKETVYLYFYGSYGFKFIYFVLIKTYLRELMEKKIKVGDKYANSDIYDISGQKKM
jgi:hypothetical protein